MTLYNQILAAISKGDSHTVYNICELQSTEKITTKPKTWYQKIFNSRSSGYQQLI